MRASNLSQAIERQNASKSATQFRQPDNCPVAVCSAIVMYEQELERHRATESRLRESVLRESDLLRQKDELILQKDILAKESEHRLLNGLQLITSLLAMQSRGTTNPEAAAQLNMAANRVSTLARVHQHLHAMDELKSVEFKQYLEKLCHDLSDMASSELAERSICVEGGELKIPKVTAVPLALIASELITNSIKYAKGKIAVSLQTMPNGDAALSVSDEGPGLPEAFDPAATNGLGMKIVAALVRQIHGELNFAKADHDQGARSSVLFSPRTARFPAAIPANGSDGRQRVGQVWDRSKTVRDGGRETPRGETHLAPEPPDTRSGRLETGAEVRAMMEDSLESTFSADPVRQRDGYVKRFRGRLQM